MAGSSEVPSGKQTTLPPEGPRTWPSTCALCGASPAASYEITPAGYGKSANGTRVLKRAPTIVPLCRPHTLRFDKEADERKLARARRGKAAN